MRDRVKQGRHGGEDTATAIRSADLPTLLEPTLLAEADCARASQCRHRERLCGVDGRRVTANDLCNERGEPHLLKHVELSCLLAAPSVPRPTLTPAARRSATGAMPLASLRFEDGNAPRRLRVVPVHVMSAG